MIRQRPAQNLRALWALHVTEGLSKQRLHSLLDHDDEYIRGWTISFFATKQHPHSDSSDNRTCCQPKNARQIRGDGKQG